MEPESPWSTFCRSENGVARGGERSPVDRAGGTQQLRRLQHGIAAQMQNGRLRAGRVTLEQRGHQPRSDVVQSVATGDDVDQDRSDLRMSVERIERRRET